MWGPGRRVAARVKNGVVTSLVRYMRVLRVVRRPPLVSKLIFVAHPLSPN